MSAYHMTTCRYCDKVVESEPDGSHSTEASTVAAIVAWLRRDYTLNRNAQLFAESIERLEWKRPGEGGQKP